MKEPSILCVDAGNTSLKLAVMRNSEALWQLSVPLHDYKAVEKSLSGTPVADGAIISSVSLPSEDLAAWIRPKVPHCMILRSDTPLPIRNGYRTPATGGNDRLAAVVGAFALHPHRNTLIIDAGTAITFDYLDSAGFYHGGNISPGLTMRFRALHDYTQRLPLLEADSEVPEFGDTTKTAIMAGVQNGVIFEINNYIRRFKANDADSIIFLTGGDTFFLADKIEYAIFAVPNLVQIGLAKVFNFNSKKENGISN